MYAAADMTSAVSDATSAASEMTSAVSDATSATFEVTSATSNKTSTPSKVTCAASEVTSKPGPRTHCQVKVASDPERGRMNPPCSRTLPVATISWTAASIGPRIAVVRRAKPSRRLTSVASCSAGMPRED